MEFGLSESPKKTSRSQEGLIVNNSQVSDNEPCEHLKGRGLMMLDSTSTF